MNDSHLSESIPPTDARILLRGEGLKKCYSIGKKKIDVLRGVDLEVAQGEFLSIIGASGSGKSTLLHILGGLDCSDGGKLLVGEEDLTRMGGLTLSRFRNRSIGFVFQAYHLFPELDALENVALPARIARKPAKEVESRARHWLEMVGLEHRMDHRPNEMSGGEQQRVAIARSLVNQPLLLLADEPTGNLDSETGMGIMQLLLKLKEECQLTMIMATHDRDMASSTDRRLQLVDGRVDGVNVA
ncbi:MAG: ABC transporter ATP-binding protein [Verrucomicrobiota bacterium]|nr:ABC transporter ATP-binding protein [Verrucomicrobiota bacterium]MDG1890827.1 ABC transporter ATP-binding protein [Verrucomicrobiota bacterium]